MIISFGLLQNNFQLSLKSGSDFKLSPLFELFFFSGFLNIFFKKKDCAIFIICCIFTPFVAVNGRFLFSK